MARFAEAADDQLALAVADQLDRFLERRAEAVGERVERARFVVKDRAPELEHADAGGSICCHGRAP